MTDAPELKALLVSREKLRDQIAADPDIPTEAISEHWNEKYLNTLHDYVELEQRLAAAEECLRSRNCDDLCLVHIQRAEAIEKERDLTRAELAEARSNGGKMWEQLIEAGEDIRKAEKERDEAKHLRDLALEQGVKDLESRQAAETALQAAREAMREECCSAICPYCDGREVIYRDDVYWHNVARGGDLGTYQVCRAAAIRAIKP